MPILPCPSGMERKILCELLMQARTHDLDLI
jgi:hypothetical protein